MARFFTGRRDLKRNEMSLVMFEIRGPKKKKVGPQFKKELNKLLRKYSGAVKLTLRTAK